VDAPLQFLGQRIVDRAVTLQPGHALEDAGDDPDAEMCLAGAVKGFLTAMVMVACMQMALVHHLQALWCELCGQLFLDRFLYGQSALLIPYLSRSHLVTKPAGPRVSADRILNRVDRTINGPRAAGRVAQDHFPGRGRGSRQVCTRTVARSTDDGKCQFLFQAPVRRYLEAYLAGFWKGMKLNSKYFEKIRIRPDPSTQPRQRPCQWDGCDGEGAYRAPVGREREGEYFFFCFDHVREYNKNYNYFSGLKDSEIARFQKEALTGHRPTWKFGSNAGGQAAPDFAPFRSGNAGHFRRIGDPFNLFSNHGYYQQARAGRMVKPLEAKALETLGLDAKATGAEIKARYKQLVKLHHPDANGGDRRSEARLRDVLQAYRLLKQSGYC
jgi:DnaJ-class molecular chaperone with C-terminal Zn finger domain